jgi:hypothetical protein
MIEDEHDFFSDLIHTYFTIWGKLFYLMFFILEELLRLGLAFYVCYLIILEVHCSNIASQEDTYISCKRI